MPVKPVNPMIARIMAGDVTMFEIVARNARISRRMADEGEARTCDPDTCKKKYCHHGNPRWVAQQRAHTEFLEAEAAERAQEISNAQ